ncbi:MAG TPA: hypothetical protein VF817_00900 [Patescibacteria group bacterium]
MERNDLIGKIVETAGDYRKGEIAKFDAAHVEKWVSQFPLPKEEQTIILHELAHMLGNFYISKQAAEKNTRRILNIMSQERAGGCPVTDVTFLRTQEEGKSQNAILEIADGILKDMHGVTTKECGGSKVFVYLDDCLYSGNKWRYDIRDSIQLPAKCEGMKIISYHFAIYSGGRDYAKPYVEGYVSQRGGQLIMFRHDWYENVRDGENSLDIIWPQYIQGNKFVTSYVSHVANFCANMGWSQRPLFRKKQRMSANVFTSAKNQHIVEQAFLDAGARMFCAANNPALSMRPMGFEVIATLGFGTPIVTWRNIPNNAPLALWYGDPSLGPNHPLGKWYPLFPRKM